MTPCWMSGDEWLTRTMRASGWMSLSITSSSMRSGNSSKMPLRRSYSPQQISTRQSSVLDLTHKDFLNLLISLFTYRLKSSTVFDLWFSLHYLIKSDYSQLNIYCNVTKPLVSVITNRQTNVYLINISCCIGINTLQWLLWQHTCHWTRSCCVPFHIQESRCSSPSLQAWSLVQQHWDNG